MLAAAGRRAFVDITAIRDQRDRRAEHEGWNRPVRHRSFRLARWDYDQRQIHGWDYDVDARQVRAGTASDEVRLLGLLTE